MRVLLDACILFPTVLREILIGAATAGGFQPLWSAKILAEWRHTAARLGPEADRIAGAEIALLNANWPDASVDFDAGVLDILTLPDRNDRHVLAAAMAGGADVLLTRNLRDFPTRVLARHDILRRDPDSFLLDFAHTGEADIATVVGEVQARTEAISGREQPLRPLLKRAGLPRLGKLLG